MKKKLLLLPILVLGLSTLLSWCKKQNIIENWDKVTLNYDSYMQDWSILEQNITQTITVWRQDSFPIFDEQLLWLKVGESKTFTTNDPNEWYWIFHDELKVQDISTAVFSTIWTTPSVWEEINLWSLKWIILETTPTTIKIDFNDRQTRENVEFTITVLNIEKSSLWD